MPEYFPTNLYPRAFWTGSLSAESTVPAVSAPPITAVIKNENVAASGKLETIVLRREELVNVGMSGIEPQELRAWRDLADGHALLGRQFEFLLDRFTGPVLSFVNTITDQNASGVASAAQSTTSFVSINRQRGLVNLGNQFVTLRNNVGSENQTMTHSHGCVVITMVCSFNAPDNSDSIRRGLLSLLPSSSRLELDVQSGMVRQHYYTSTGSLWTRAVSVNWPSGSTVTFISQWQSTKSQDLLVTVQNSYTITATFDQTGSAGIPGSLSTLANTAVLMGINLFDGTPGVIFHAGFYRMAYYDPTILASHFPMGRTYWPKAELTGMQAFQPARANPSIDLWDITLAIRKGF